VILRIYAKESKRITFSHKITFLSESISIENQNQMDVVTNIEITRIDFDYAYLPAAGAVNGTLVARCHDLWSAGLQPCVISL
jgi:hypothetical protein